MQSAEPEKKVDTAHYLDEYLRLLSENNQLLKENNAILKENNAILKMDHETILGISENVRKIKYNTQ